MFKTIISLSGLLFIAFAAPASFAMNSSITPQEALDLVNQGDAIMVDVREESEIHETGMAEPAEWLPTTDINVRGPRYQSALLRWSKTKPIIFYCRSGNRSGKALTLFTGLGYTGLNMGAFQSWKDAGLPTKATP